MMRPLSFVPVLFALLVAVGCSSETTTAPSTAEPTTAETAPSPEPTTLADTATEEPIAAKAETNIGGDILAAVFVEGEVAIAGADPVAYFTDGAYVPGSDEFTHEWSGAIWRFASAENRDAFASNPASYAPQYGGFCAWAVSQGYTAPIDPEAWKVVDGKLYLNYDKNVQARWERDISGNIAKADANWPAVADQ